MSASEVAKNAGLNSLKQVSEMMGESTQTLNNWYNNKPKLFDAVILYCSIQIALESIKNRNIKC